MKHIARPFSQLTRLLPVLLIFFTLMGTQFSVSLHITNRTVYVYLAEVIMLISSVAVMVSMLIKGQSQAFRFPQWLLTAAMIAWFFILTAYRYFTFGDLTGGFIIFRVLMLPVVFVLSLRHLNMSKTHIVWGIFLFVTAINGHQMFSLFQTASFRTVQALQNINIYLCFMLAALPFLLVMLRQLYFSSKALRILMGALLAWNILTILVFAFFSGSRLAAALLPLCFFSAFWLVFGFSKKAFLSLGALVLAFVVILGTVLSCDLYDSRYNVSRTYTEVLHALHAELPGDFAQPDNGSSDVDDQTAAENNVADSNTMRKLLWQTSLNHILKSPFWGRTSVDVEIEMSFVGSQTPVKVIQAPHNFILEGWMGLGLPGLLIYGAILLLAILPILRRKTPLCQKLLLFVTLLAVFGFSFFQPLVTCYFAISLILWLSLYLYRDIPN